MTLDPKQQHTPLDILVFTNLRYISFATTSIDFRLQILMLVVFTVSYFVTIIM